VTLLVHMNTFTSQSTGAGGILIYGPETAESASLTDPKCKPWFGIQTPFVSRHFIPVECSVSQTKKTHAASMSDGINHLHGIDHLHGPSPPPPHRQQQRVQRVNDREAQAQPVHTTPATLPCSTTGAQLVMAPRILPAWTVSISRARVLVILMHPCPPLDGGGHVQAVLQGILDGP
jgi:hypothetical protein